MTQAHYPATAVQSSTLADVLERVLDKGVVIAGDIKVKLVEVELLSVQIRLMVCSVDKAREIGMDWWVSDPYLSAASARLEEENRQLRLRLERLEAQLAEPDHRK